MKSKEHTLKKLAKWFQRAEECTDRSEVEKILRKAEKHQKRLDLLDNGGDT